MSLQANRHNGTILVKFSYTSPAWKESERNWGLVAVPEELHGREFSTDERCRVFEIAQQSRKMGEAAQAKMKSAYRRVIGTTRAVLGEAHRTVGGREAEGLPVWSGRSTSGEGTEPKRGANE